jgi:hypothetical protein
MTDRDQGDFRRDRAGDETAGRRTRAPASDGFYHRERQEGRHEDEQSRNGSAARTSGLTERERQERWPVG